MQLSQQQSGNCHCLASSVSAQGLRGYAEGPQECPTHAFAVRKSRLLRHDVNGMPPLLYHKPGSFQSKSLDGLGRRLAGLGQKGAAELTGAKVGHRCKLVDRERVPEILTDVCQNQLDAVGFRRHVEEGGMRHLPAQSTRGHNQKPGDHFSGLGTEIVVDQSQNEIEARGHAGRGPDRTIIDEDPVLFDPDIWKANPEVGRMCPMHRCASTVQKAGVKRVALQVAGGSQ